MAFLNSTITELTFGPIPAMGPSSQTSFQDTRQCGHHSPRTCDIHKTDPPYSSNLMPAHAFDSGYCILVKTLIPTHPFPNKVRLCQRYISYSSYFSLVVEVRSPGSEKCAADIHRSCEKTIFYQMVVNHMAWPKTTKWRQCYNEALTQKPCPAPILQNYSTLQEKFGESLRQREYTLGLFGIFMNDNKQESQQL